MTQSQKNPKKTIQARKKGSFFTSVLTIAREMVKKQREKYRQDVSVNLSENTPQRQKQ